MKRSSATMWAARLHGPRDLRLEQVPRPRPPGRGEALLRVTATGICGSDLHTYLDGRIGDTVLQGPLVLGHEFAGVVAAVGPAALDGNGEPLRPGTRVAVDPAMPCHRCDQCEHGHPNLCRRLHFCGLYPDDGSLREFMVMPARACFPVPAKVDDVAALMLEPLGVALHATDLAKIRIGERVAILGAGPIGLLLLQTVKLAGAGEVFITDPLPWRRKLARHFGAKLLPPGAEVDVAIEAAWGGDAISQAVELVRPGGRVVLVGIPTDDACPIRHTSGRRKGLTVIFSRRMKHAYPRTIPLVATGRVDVKRLVTHRFSLRQVAQAFAIAAGYQDGVVKAVVTN